MSKICNKCNIEKCFDLYHKDKSKKDGYRNSCKLCQKSYSKKFYSFNEGKIREYGTNRYNELKYDDAFKERTKEIRKKYNIKNRIKVKLRCKKYNQENKDNIREQKRVYRKNNREVLLNYRNKNIDRIRKTSNEWTKRRLNSDPLFKLSTNIRKLILISIKKQGFTKKTKTVDILDCSIVEFRIYLESKFDSWMTWDNHGKYNGELNYGWDMDHIIPMASAKNEEEVIRLNHYTNFQPLDSYENRVIKRDKLVYG